MKKYFIGVDVGGTKISAALVDASGKVLARAKTATPLKAQGKDIAKIILATIEYVQKEQAPKKISGIGMGIPGIVQPKSQEILVTPNIRLAGFPLQKTVAKAFKTKVRMDNDVNCGLMGEFWLGAARKKDHVIGLFPGTGIGGAIVTNGRLVPGSQGAAAELGHMIMQVNGPQCSCGNKGCLEALASRWAIQRDILSGIKAGRKSIITELSKNNLAVIKSKALSQALVQKDALITEIMANAGLVLGQACVSINHIFNPQMIVLGGGVIEACGDFLLPRIRKTVTSDPFFKKFKPCQITEAELKDDATMLGAAALIKNHP